MIKLQKTRGVGLRGLKTSSKRAFTLAEVLTTLAIIGVVAALTIPALVHKYQQKQYYTQFMKTYNTLSKVIQLVFSQDGPFESITEEDISDDELFNKYFAEHFNIASVDDIPTYSVKDLEEMGNTLLAHYRRLIAIRKANPEMLQRKISILRTI